jgi:predicted nucleotidyltransferase
MARKSPYNHVDGSPCWTKDCKRGHAILQSFKEKLTVGYTGVSFSDFEKEIKANGTKPVLNKDFTLLNTPTDVTRFVPEKNVLFKTVHGSHLYGLNHPGSDTDYYMVVMPESNSSHRKTKQTIVDGIDTVKNSLSHFLELAETGSHQALEAMFSEKTVGDPIEALRRNFYVGTNVFNIYERTIRNFALSQDFKRRRHALRLTINLNEMMKRGRFNPTLEPKIADVITQKTNATFDEYFQYLNNLSDMELQWQKTDRSK